ncbi:hypothetical protein [Paramuribaculum intestinale]|uniref:hypothetical protein n=1 Tax=Paramuribaculum intestinale TaxID=2094151 RepID=UPI0025B6B708|nr:hypothetical protein [Paramuribaculum intestinale]
MIKTPKKRELVLPVPPQRVDVVIGIDPDAEKNGVAMLQRADREIEAMALNFPDTLEYLRYAHAQSKTAGRTMRVVIEAGWLNKTHWHVGYRDSAQEAAAKGNSVGRNHETGRKIAEMCEYWQIPYELIKPLPLKAGGVNLWKGKDGKITAGELAAITGLGGRTNQEARDAALIAWTWAGLPVSTRVKKINQKIDF